MTSDTRWWMVGALLGAQLVLAACSGDDGAVDAGPDGPPKDMTRDTSVDLGSNPCAAGATVAKAFSDSMVTCDGGGATTLTQCEAEALCNVDAGWSLCTASQYQQRDDSSGSPVEAWIKGCVRDSNNAPVPPRDELCTCERVIGTDAYDLAWSCTGVALHKDVRQWYIAVITDPLCHRVGVNVETTESHWTTLASYTLRGAAMCCR